MNKYEYLLQDLTKLKGVGRKTASILKKKNINTFLDIIFRLPESYTDRTNLVNISSLQIGKISTIKVKGRPILNLKTEND